MKEIRMPFDEYEKTQKELEDLRKEVDLHRGNVPRLVIDELRYHFRSPQTVSLTEAQAEIQRIVERNEALNKEVYQLKMIEKQLKRKIKYFNELTLWERMRYNPVEYRDPNFL